jgi:hypothetical protein
MPIYVTLGPEGKAALSGGLGAVAGSATTVITQTLDSRGQTGKNPLPQLGGFGTWGALWDEATGGIALAVGLAGCLGKGPTKRHPSANAGLIGYGASAIAGRTAAVMLNTPAVTVPGAIAKGAAANPSLSQARANAGLQRRGAQALYTGGIAPRNATTGVGATSYSQARFS